MRCRLVRSHETDRTELIDRSENLGSDAMVLCDRRMAAVNKKSRISQYWSRCAEYQLSFPGNLVELETVTGAEIAAGLEFETLFQRW